MNLVAKYVTALVKDTALWISAEVCRVWRIITASVRQMGGQSDLSALIFPFISVTLGWKYKQLSWLNVLNLNCLQNSNKFHKHFYCSFWPITGSPVSNSSRTLLKVPPWDAAHKVGISMAYL